MASGLGPHALYKGLCNNAQAKRAYTIKETIFLYIKTICTGVQKQTRVQNHTGLWLLVITISALYTPVQGSTRYAQERRGNALIAA
jgi:hypothetical protein